MKHILWQDLGGFRYAADEGGGAAPAIPDAGAGQPAVPATPAASVPSSAATPAASSAASGGSAAPSAPAWLESLKKDGMDFGADESAAFARIKQLKAERDQLDSFRNYIPHIHDYLQNAKDFQNWRAEQAKQQKAQAQAQTPAQGDQPVWSKYWSPPEYDPSWERRYIVRNPDGTMAWDKNTPPEIIAKAQAYASWRSDQAEKLIANPHEFLAPTVQALAEKIANDVVEKRFGQQQTVGNASTFIQQNRHWIYELGENGQPKQAQMFDPAVGQNRLIPVLSPLGKRFQDYATEIHARQQARGYADDDEMTAMAQALTYRDWLDADHARLKGELEQLKGGQAGGPQAAPLTPQQQANADFLKKNNPAGKAQTAPVGRGGANVNPAEPKVTRKNLEKTLRDSLIGAGFTNGVGK